MVYADVGDGHTNGIMADDQQSLVIVLDESCCERRFDNKTHANGVHPPHTDDKVEGILSKDDIELLLSIFDTVITTPSPTDCLALLVPKVTAPAPPPTLFLVPLSPPSMSPTNTPLTVHTAPQTASDDTPTPRSSTSHKKHGGSDSSEKMTFGLEFLRLLQQNSQEMAHIVPVALCRKGEHWSKDNLVKLLDLGVRDILTVPCESANFGALLMHLRERVSNPLEETIAIQRYQKSRVSPETRHAVINSWIQNNTIIDLLVQSYAPQPNLLRRPLSSSELLPSVSQFHLEDLATKVNDWDFHAGRLGEEDLIYASVLILEHVLETGGQELSPFRISRDEIILFMLTVKSCYQPTNHYHNFRHAIDVLQATFQILILSQIIPPLPAPSSCPITPVTPILPSNYLTPIEILSLCIAAVGHDAAHPGVTNAFLAASNSSLATIFNERSVLENLHCLTIGRIIDERWPSLYADDEGRFRKVILECILSTDMALHFDFMVRFEALRKSIATDPIDEKQRRLICCCIMKSSDISNLARPLDISTDWTLVLQKEVSAQEDLASHLNISLSLPVSPTTTRGTTPTTAEQESALAKSQLGFIDIFAEPLWAIGADLFFPGMVLGLKQIQANRAVWMSKAQRPPMDEATSSGSTMTGGTKSDATTTTETAGGSGLRKVASSGELNGHNGKGSRMRKEKSFSSLMFWKKKRGQAVSPEPLPAPH